MFATFYLLHRIQMIAITMRNSISVKILVFTLEVGTEEQGTLKSGGTGKQFWETVSRREIRLIPALEADVWQGTRFARL